MIPRTDPSFLFANLHEVQVACTTTPIPGAGLDLEPKTAFFRYKNPPVPPSSDQNLIESD